MSCWMTTLVLHIILAALLTATDPERAWVGIECIDAMGPVRPTNPPDRTWILLPLANMSVRCHGRENIYHERVGLRYGVRRGGPPGNSD